VGEYEKAIADFNTLFQFEQIVPTGYAAEAYNERGKA
jgi:hypothetical protein